MRYKSYPRDTEASLLFECQVLSSREATCHLTAVSRQGAGMTAFSKQGAWGSKKFTVLSAYPQCGKGVCGVYGIRALVYLRGNLEKRNS